MFRQLQGMANVMQEKGAFPALRAGQLRALQVYVHTDPLNRSKVIEMYTFTIKYKDAGNHRVPSGLEFGAPGDPLVSVEATNLAFRTLLHQLSDVCDRLPVLPRKSCYWKLECTGY